MRHKALKARTFIFVSLVNINVDFFLPKFASINFEFEKIANSCNRLS